MQDGCIAVALGLPQLRILKQEELEGHFEVTVIYRRTGAVCPRCGMTTTKEHDRRPQIKQDRRLRDKVVFLTLMKRRFRCLWCGKVFTEPDEVFGPRRRSSHRFREYLGQEALPGSSHFSIGFLVSSARNMATGGQDYLRLT